MAIVQSPEAVVDIMIVDSGSLAIWRRAVPLRHAFGRGKAQRNARSSAVRRVHPLALPLKQLLTKTTDAVARDEIPHVRRILALLEGIREDPCGGGGVVTAGRGRHSGALQKEQQK